ncbi:MAG: hypothetical protein R3350_01055 [Saprospiraceae bacterium]|nr:hypothetical protein [Saprospiraceae bacterium]
MGILNEFRKLLFGAKSVAKSTGKKAGEEIQEKSKEALDKAGETVEKTKKTVTKASGDLFKKADDFLDRMQQKRDEERQREESETAEFSSEEAASNLVDDIFDESESGEDSEGKEPKSGEMDEAVEKMKGFLDEVGEEVFRQGGALADKLREATEKVGRRVIESSDELGKNIQSSDAWGQAKTWGEQLRQKAEELVQKAQEEAAREKSVDDAISRAQKVAKDLEDKVEQSESELKDRLKKSQEKADQQMGSFFEKAKRFSEGNYGMEEEKKTKLEKDPDYKPRKKEGSIPGFEDRDGDGDELIDDAIIDEEE